MARKTPTPRGVISTAQHFLHVLRADDLPTPRFKIQNNLGARWLGRTVYRVRIQPSGQTYSEVEIILQKSILADETTMRRVVAHEVIHYVEFFRDPPSLVEMNMGLTVAHGTAFHRHAEAINEVEGEDFVTVTSDMSYDVRVDAQEIYVLLVATGRGDQIGWQWAARPSERQLDYVMRKLASSPSRFIRTPATRLLTAGVRIGARGLSIPTGSEKSLPLKAELRRLFDAASEALATQRR